MTKCITKVAVKVEIQAKFESVYHLGLPRGLEGHSREQLPWSSEDAMKEIGQSLLRWDSGLGKNGEWFGNEAFVQKGGVEGVGRR